MEQSQLDIKQIETAIIKGAKYLLRSVNFDNGLYYENETSSCSGIWTTAEALEFFLTTRTLPIVAYCDKIQPMLEYLLSTQRNDGSWAEFSEQENKTQVSSTISTGHCVYALKLSLVGDFLEGPIKENITNAIAKGENWLSKCCIEQNQYAFWWDIDVSNHSDINPNENEESRMKSIFCSFYSALGITNPYNFSSSSDKIEILKSKVCLFFKEQLNWFLDYYGSSKQSKAAKEKLLPNVVSILFWIVNIAEFFGRNNVYDDKTAQKIKKILNESIFNSHIIRKIKINEEVEYIDNIPYHTAITLMNLQTNIDDLKNIIEGFLKEQQSDGFWYGNFKNKYKVKIWSTSEALLVLEKSIHSYNRELVNLKDKYIQLRKYFKISLAISIILAITAIFKNLDDVIRYIPNLIFNSISIISGIITILIYFREKFDNLKIFK